MIGPGKTQQSIRAHLVAIGATAVFLVGGVGVIGATTDLAGAVIAAGTLVVESNVKKVQHPTGGIVGDLLVHDGSRVEAGELLVRLDETTAQANLAMVDKSLTELFARRARLEAERDGADTVEFPEELLQAARQAEIARVVAGEYKLFQLRREAQDGQKAQLRERIVQLSEEVRGYTDQAGAKTKEIEFIQKELEGVRDLWQKNLVPITRVTALERDGARLEGERGQLVATVAQGFRRPSFRSSSSIRTCAATWPRSWPTSAPRSRNWSNARSRRWISCNESRSALRKPVSCNSLQCMRKAPSSDRPNKSC
jgi:HlyD family secretion protein